MRKTLKRICGWKEAMDKNHNSSLYANKFVYKNCEKCNGKNRNCDYYTNYEVEVKEDDKR